MKTNLKEILVCLLISSMIAWLSRYTRGELATPYISGVTPPTFRRGWPLGYYYQRACGIIPLSGKCPSGRIDPLAFLLNLVFWFLLVFGTWQIIKFFKVKLVKK